MWEAIAAFFRAWSSTNEVVSKALPSDELREKKFDIGKPSLEVKERLKIEDMLFIRLRNNPEANIESAVEFIDSRLNKDDRKALVENLTNRIDNYRKTHPIVSGWRRFSRSK